jgi:probable HAF family extracellular repeat protein
MRVRSSALGVVVALALAAPAPAATVRAFALPAGYAVEPESEMPAIGLDAHGNVVALARQTGMHWAVRAFRWTSDGVRSAFAPLPLRSIAHQQTPDALERVAIGPNGETYVTVGLELEELGGTPYEVERWTESGAAVWDPPSCPGAEPDERDQHVGAIDALGRVALTLDVTGPGSMEVLDDTTGALAPFAYVIEGERCAPLGRATVEALRGRYAAGYRGYLDGHLAPDNLNTIRQQYVAVRWTDGVLGELGPGVAYAVTSGGLVVGADALPGHVGTEVISGGGATERNSWATPHAVAWDASGAQIVLVAQARRSVAYDVADDGTVVGMLQEQDGKRYAFRWRHGRAQRLDDLPHPPEWRFACAYAIASDGTIAGIGTYRGVPTAFTWRS